MRRYIAGGFAALCLLLGCRGWGQPSPEVYSLLEPEAFQEKMRADSTVLLIDVRRPSEFTNGHIEGAENLNILEGDTFSEGMEGRDRDRPVMLYCRSGRRSLRAAKILEEMGFTDITDLKGGFLAWTEEKE